MSYLNDYKKFAEMVLKDEGHEDYSCEWQYRSCEGYCWRNQKKLTIGLENNDVPSLILHEISHIGTGCGHGNQHEETFWAKRIRLQMKYQPDKPLTESEMITIRAYKIDLQKLLVDDKLKGKRQ